MNRQKFLGIVGGTVALAGGTYLFSDRSNYTRAESEQTRIGTTQLTADEREILFLASLAPSGHNTQPWFIKHREPYHWIVGNDKKRWLPGVDPTQRETILSIGAFLQTMEYAASSLGYVCQFDTLATSNQADEIVQRRKDIVLSCSFLFNGLKFLLGISTIRRVNSLVKNKSGDGSPPLLLDQSIST